MPVLSTIGAAAARGFGWLYKAVGGGTAGALYTWGSNSSGLLGIGVAGNRSSPVQVGSDTAWTDASMSLHVIAVKNDGSLWAWGEGGNGSLGLGSTTDYSSPVQVGALTNWSTAQAQYIGSLALKTDGTLWSWGSGIYGRLGDGTTTNKSSPVQIGALTSWTKIGYGPSANLNCHAIRSGNTLWAWGFGNPNYTDSYGTILNRPYPTVNQSDYSSPVQVSSAISWASVSTGNEHALALTTGGALYAWGTNGNGQCGLSTLNNPEYYVWYALESGCSGGGSATYGALYATDIGAGSYQNLNNPGAATCEPPIDGVTATFISQGANTHLWGFSSPVQVGSDTNWAQVSTGFLTSGAVKTTGTLWMWGYNIYGQLGLGNTASRSSPTQVGSLTTWAYVKCGQEHSLAVKTDGTLWAWGRNIFGELGQGDTTNRSSPVQIGSATNWLKAIDALDAGYRASIAIRT